MNNTNYGYSPSGYPSPYSSTPTGIRTQRPRFGYSAPSMYPRPRSSASKPNPDSFSDSMINNYGTSSSQIDVSFNSENGNSYDDSYNSNYYTANESFYSNNQSSNTSMLKDNSMMYDSPSMMRGNVGRGERAIGRGGMPMQSSALLSEPLLKFPKYSTFNMNNTGEFKGNLQKSPAFGEKNNKPPFTRKFNKAKRMGKKQLEGALKCDLCDLQFTSQIPYDMHLQGARHAKKMKAKVALSAMQAPTVRGPTEADKTFFCELCNVRTNSSLQLQTHLEGNKHKNKLQPKEPKEPKEQSEEGSKPEKKTAKPVTETSVNGKSNGSVIRPLPPDFGEPQASKITKYACDVCCVAVNSEIQLQQHLTSKKHQNKIEGRPMSKAKRMKTGHKKTPKTDADKIESFTMAEVVSDTVTNEASTKVVGVKTLASSFVLGETLQ